MRISHAAMVLVALSFVGCSDDYAAVERGKLVVSPESLTFSLPSPGQNVSEASLTLSNLGAQSILIYGVAVKENDDTPEVSLLDAQDWTSGQRTLLGGANDEMKLRWTALDAQTDEGVVTLDTSVGEVTVPFTTLDIDPVIEVTTTPVGVREANGTSVELSPSSATTPVRVVVRSASIAPLSLETVCLLDGNGACVEGAADEGAWHLCGAAPSTLEGCTGVELGDPLEFGETATFTVFHTPPPGNVDTLVGRVRVLSNAGQTPSWTVSITASALPGRCGDGVVQSGEACDDGNEVQTDDCLNNCQQASCGDGFVWEGVEDCDAGEGNSDELANACRTSCELAGCGDGVVDDGEDCDLGEGNSDELADTCRTSCVLPFCGDGVQDGDEACDHGNLNSDIEPNACRSACLLPFCGDGVRDGDEACDLGEGNSDELADTCRTNCLLPFCGDGVQDGDEECDDGNSEDGDGCSSECLRPQECVTQLIVHLDNEEVAVFQLGDFQFPERVKIGLKMHSINIQASNMAVDNFEILNSENERLYLAEFDSQGDWQWASGNIGGVRFNGQVTSLSDWAYIIPSSTVESGDGFAVELEVYYAPTSSDIIIPIYSGPAPFRRLGRNGLPPDNDARHGYLNVGHCAYGNRNGPSCVSFSWSENGGAPFEGALIERPAPSVGWHTLRAEYVPCPL